MTLRVHELAKELKLGSKELLDRAKELKMDLKSHMSVLTEAQAAEIKQSYAPAKKAPAAAPAPRAASGTSTGLEGAKSSIASLKKEIATEKAAVKTTPQQDHKRSAAHVAPAPKPAPVFSRSAPLTAAAKPKDKPPVPAQEVRRETPVVPAQPPAAAAPIRTDAPRPVETAKPVRRVEVQAPVSVKDLAAKLSVRPNDLIAQLIRLGIFANINQSVNFEVAAKAATVFGFELAEIKKPDVSDAAAKPTAAAHTKNHVTRAPIVTFMGHVDHGKTSLLDAIRKTKVAAGEAGGITQHIGAYEVFLPNGSITFLDTPGHEAFTAMRARGAKVTDVVVLVVAADDGVMPQTEEAIDHAQAAGVPIVVAINKVDLPSANIDRVKKELMEFNLMTEEWGGKTVMVGVSAKTGQGIDQLLEMLALESELLELKADPTASATGTVVEAELSKDTGVLATVLVQQGTLRVGDFLVIANSYGKIRAMINDRGQRIKEAPPSTPVEVLGLSEVPRAGDVFTVARDERAAKEIVEQRLAEQREGRGRQTAHVRLEQIFEDVRSGKIQELKLILKSDVQGSLEALRGTLQKIPSKNVRLNVIHSGIGEVSESDVMLAMASEAIVIAFHVGMSPAASQTAEREGVDVRFYEIIYEAQSAIEKAMEGLLQPELKETVVGAAEVRQVFKVSKHGTIAGCTVQKGKIVRNYQCRVIRAGAKLIESKIDSLKRFKDDAREVTEGFECGIGVARFEEFQPGDRIEVYEIQKIARKLE